MNEEMIIRKLFKFDGCHIVRNCSSDRCKKSLHAHTYTVELFFTSDDIDNGQMVVDFGLMKGTIKEFIKSFDQSITIWNHENDKGYIERVKGIFPRQVYLPFSPSAEMYSVTFYHVVEAIMKATEWNNGEVYPRLVKVRVHETRTGWAECNAPIFYFKMDQIQFSEAIKQSWKDQQWWDKLLKASESWTDEKVFINPKVERQV